MTTSQSTTENDTEQKVSVQKVTLRKKCPLIISDFNVEPNEANMKAFCSQYKLKSLNKEATCFKNVNKPSCIDFFLTSNSKSFENCLTLETGLSDFHKLIVTIMKTKRQRLPPKIINYRDYKNFDSEVFKDRLN